jgi:hypothetical protein
MTGGAHFTGVLLLLLAASPAQNPKKILKLEADFARQKDPVHQAKSLAKLLPAEIGMAGEEMQQGDYDQGIARLEHWSNETQQVDDALVATGRNPVKKPEGFTELQVALRESLRAMRDIVFALPLGRRHRAESVEANLSQINSQLLQELFPPPPPQSMPKKKSR